MIFSKEEQTIVSYWRLARCFQVTTISILAIRSQTHLTKVSENWLISF